MTRKTFIGEANLQADVIASPAEFVFEFKGAAVFILFDYQ